MQLRFYKDTLTESEIIELLKFDSNFKLSGTPIIEYKERTRHDGWYDDSGSFDVYQSEESRKNRPEGEYIRLYPYMRFNAQQLELYMKFIAAKYSKTICPYWIIRNEEEKKAVIGKVGKFDDLNHGFPCIVGKEESFVFQCPGTTIYDYYSHDNKTLYKYELQTF
jgi:hypothetical protein